MGSTGSNESAHKAYLQQGNFDTLSEYDEQVLNDAAVSATYTGSPYVNGWDFPGIRDRVNELTRRLDNTNSTNAIASIRRALIQQDTIISQNLNENNSNYDRNALLTYRRQVRQALNKIKVKKD